MAANRRNAQAMAKAIAKALRKHHSKKKSSRRVRPVLELSIILLAVGKVLETVHRLGLI